MAWQPILCDSCGASWTDLYRLTGIVDLEDKDGKEIEILPF
jgi:hypothetical protein